MTSRDERTVRAILRASACAPYRAAADVDHMLLRGWRMTPTGPVQFGWWAYGPDGTRSYLGRTIDDVRRRVAEVDAMLAKVQQGGHP